MSWDDYNRDDAEKGIGGDWVDPPDDLYDARVLDVSEPEVQTNIFKKSDSDPETNTQFFITWELLPTAQQVEDGCPEAPTLRYYCNIPERFLNEGYLGEKSKLYGVMTALGFDLEQPFRFAPMEWIDMRARVLVEQVETKNGMRARITKIQPAKRKASPPTPAPRAAGSRQPVGAGASRAPLRERLQPTSSDEEFE